MQRVFHYQDAQTDDAALTRAVAASARELGACLLCPARFAGAERHEAGYRIRVETESGPAEMTCSVLINAAGPWIDAVCQLVDPVPPRFDVDLVRGSHLVLEPMLSDRCYYMEAPRDGRAVFVLPWRGRTLLGTTETHFRGDPADVRTSTEEEDYLLEVLTRYFPDYIRHPDFAVVERMAGLRVLPHSGKNPFKRSREVMFATDLDRKGGYIGVYGGKLTGYRATAERITRLVKKTLGPRQRIADTASLKLPESAAAPGAR